jgi:hypothetical protein
MKQYFDLELQKLLSQERGAETPEPEEEVRPFPVVAQPASAARPASVARPASASEELARLLESARLDLRDQLKRPQDRIPDPGC